MQIFQSLINFALNILNTPITIFGYSFSFLQFFVVSSIITIIISAIKSIFD